MKKSKNGLFLLVSILMIATTLFLSGCDDDDTDPVNEEELITTLTLSFQRLNATTGSPEGDPILFSWRDLDGQGSGAPEIDEIILAAHSNYELKVTLLDESKTPAADISAEVEKEKEDHQFFFVSDGADLIITYNDTDGAGKPLGATNLAVTDHEGSGTLKVILRHEPNKSGFGVANGDPANAGGDTDIEAIFPVSIIE